MLRRCATTLRPHAGVLLLWVLSVARTTHAASLPADSPTLHVVLAVDLKAEGLQESLTLDLDGLRDQFRSHVKDDHLNVVEMTQDLTRANVLGLFNEGRVKGRDVAPNDAIVFIYDGHGSYDPDRRDAVLDLSSGEILFLGDVVNAVKSCKPRLTVTINLACAGMRKNPLVKYQAEAKEVSIAPVGEPYTIIFKKLFVEPRGAVVLSAARPGQFAASYPGEPTPDGDALIFRGTIFAQKLIEEFNPFGTRRVVSVGVGPGVERPHLPQLAQPPDWPELVEHLKQAVSLDYEFYIHKFNRVPGQATQTVDAVLDLEARATITQWGVTVAPVPNGLELREVTPGSWAAAANLHVGDVVVGVSTVELDTPADLRNALAGLDDDDLFRVVGFRPDGQAFEFTRRLRDGVASAPPRSFGATTATVPQGLRLSSVQPNSLAAILKLKPGDILVSLNGRPMQKPSDLEGALAATKSDAKMAVKVIDATSGELRSDSIITIVQ